jgi:hypothetical protein
MPEDPSASPGPEFQNSENLEHPAPRPEAASETVSAPKQTLPPRTPITVKVERSTSDKVLGQISKAAKEFWQKAQPVLKEKSIQALRASNRLTNNFLDRTWPKLSAQVIAAVPGSTKAKIETQKAKLQPTLEKLQPVWEKGILPLWHNFVVPLWSKGLDLLKRRLPGTLASELTDRFLTIAIISALVLVYWFFSSLTAGKPAVAKQPTFPKPTTEPIVTRPIVEPIRPSAAPKKAPVIAAQPSKPPSKLPANTSAQPVKPSPEAPKPILDLSEVQTQLASTVANVDPGLIASVRLLESNRRLQATLGETWFGLNSVAQDQVAQDLWERSKSLKFEQFELRDDGGELVARSPVVGPNIIVFKRQNSPGMA